MCITKLVVHLLSGHLESTRYSLDSKITSGLVLCFCSPHSLPGRTEGEKNCPKFLYGKDLQPIFYHYTPFLHPYRILHLSKVVSSFVLLSPLLRYVGGKNIISKELKCEGYM